MINVQFFGCKGRPGHALFTKDWMPVTTPSARALTILIDAQLAPYVGPDGEVFFSDSGSWRGRECRQGVFLRHERMHERTIISWWDRCQGDTRPGSNSALVVSGDRRPGEPLILSSGEMLELLRANFPSVEENLIRGGFALTEIVAQPEKKKEKAKR